VDNALGMLVVLALVASGSAQVFMAMELRRMRLGLAAKKGGVDVPDGVTSHHSPAWPGMVASPCGYAIYVYRAGRWELESDLSAPGYEPSSPTLRGAYEGQVIKKESAPAR
jgi:hypothetical protein